MDTVIILAAGASSRLGRPKQLLQYGGKTLLQHVIDVASATWSNPTIVVVLGAAFEEIYATIKDSPVSIIENKSWQTGIGSSIRAGIRQLQHIAPQTERVYLLLCDQPFITSRLLQEMQRLTEQTAKGIIACTYSDTAGVPMLIHRRYFDELLILPNTTGAKKLLSAHPDDVSLVPFPEGTIDMDTEADLWRLEAT